MFYNISVISFPHLLASQRSMRRKRQSSLIAEQERSKPVNGAGTTKEHAVHDVNMNSTTNLNNHSVVAQPIDPSDDVTITGLPDETTGDFSTVNV